MTERIDGGLPLQQSVVPAGQSTKGEAAGSYRGQAVTVKADALSLIADAAEELTFAASERVEKNISKRKIGRAGGMKTSAMERAEAYLKRLPDLQRAEKLQQFTEHLKKQGEQTPQQLMKAAREFFGDVSHQFAGLSFARETLHDEGESTGLVEALDRTLEDLLKEKGPEIRAGMNVSETASFFSDEGLGDVRTLRDHYRETVLQYEGFHETYTSILKTYGESRFQDGVSYLIKAVGNDLHAKGPSISGPELKLILDDLYQVEVLGNVHRACSALLEKMESQFSLRTRGKAQNLMKQVLDLKAGNLPRPRGEAVLPIVRNTGIRRTDAQIYFLTEFKKLVSDMPVKVYDDDLDHRKNVIDSVQLALNEAIGREEKQTT